MAHSHINLVASPRRLHRAKRTTASKLTEIAMRSPKDLRAIDTVADMVIARLNADDAARHKPH